VDDETNGHDEGLVDESSGLLSPATARRDPLYATNTPHNRRQSVFGILNERQPSVAYDRRPSVISKKRWFTLGPRSRWWLLFLFDFLNAPLFGAVLGAIVGLVPALHVAFFNDTQEGGIFTAWFTASIQTIGSLFVPLPVVIAGVSLYTSYVAARGQTQQSSNNNHQATYTTVFVLVVRFIIWPIASIALIYALASRTSLLGSDPMLWFTLMLMLQAHLP